MSKLMILAICCLMATTSLAAETITTKSGLEYTSLREGTGATPGPADTVSVTYHGTLLNGRVFDSSRGRSVQFPLTGVIKCWTEGLQLMKVGGKAQLVCPSNLAYGEEGVPGSVPRNAVLIFEVELLAIK